MRVVICSAILALYGVTPLWIDIHNSEERGDVPAQ